MQVVVLASGSRYRAALLGRLGLEFIKISPDIDETAAESENAEQLCQRLASEKAQAVMDTLQGNEHHDAEHLIIASDQVALCKRPIMGKNAMLGKPGTVEQAISQLTQISGQHVTFLTAVHMLNTFDGECYTALDATHVHVRKLHADEIQRYVKREPALDCAGSFMAESLGVSLFESINSQDPTGLIGLPLIKVCEGLRHFGLQVP